MDENHSRSAFDKKVATQREGELAQNLPANTLLN